MEGFDIQITSAADVDALLEEGRTVERTRFGKWLKWYISTIHESAEAKTRATITPESMHEHNRQLGVTDACREFLSPLYGLEAFLNEQRMAVQLAEEMARAISLDAQEAAEQVSPHS